MTAICWTLPCELLTPAFLGGAEPNKQAELRPPSIRGALRAWWRLVVGPDISAEHRHPLSEATLFGNSGQGKVLLSLVQPVKDGDTTWNSARERTRRPGAAYFGFPLEMGTNQRRALPSGTRFDLRLTMPRGLLPEQERALWATLWCWSHLGGIGSRSRRGFGSIQPTWPPIVTDLRGAPVPGPEQRSGPGTPTVTDLRGAPVPGPEQLSGATPFHLPALGNATSLRELAERIADTAHDLKPLRRYSQGSTAPVYWLGGPGPGARVAVWGGPDRQGFADGLDAVDAVGRSMMELRRTRGIDGPTPTLATLLAQKRLVLAPQRAAFGLPLALRPKQGGKRFELLPHVPGPRAGRMPSPLLIRALRVNGRYYAILTLLAGRWPGRDVPLAHPDGGRGYIEADPGIDLPTRFLKQLPGRLEVPL